jgi:arabinose-5-phosphate isomerase
MVFDESSALARGKETLRLESQALNGLADQLGDPFLAACQSLLHCSGRIVVTGMGKAGLVGQKISATFASTGTPSLFLHPAEALHGDLGRVQKEDLVLALSKSGKTRELLYLVPAAKALGAQVLAICAQKDSPLAQEADLTLILEDSSEACPLGLAPTVSTTQMLGLGDALAMAILEGRDFTREEFARFHPAGSLGRDLMHIGEMMRQEKELPLVPSGTSLQETLITMGSTPGRPGAALIVNNQQHLLGIFTDGDLRRLAGQGNFDATAAVDTVMAKKPTTLSQALLVGEALRLFKDTHVDQMPVVDKSGKVVGLVDVQDLLEVKL